MPITVTYKPNGRLPFDPLFRTGNCYTYALGIKDLGRMKPGQLKQQFCTAISPENLNAGYIAQQLKQDNLIQIREHKLTQDQILACFVAPGYDYHFYRLQPDNIWSHKIDPKAPTIYDSSGKIIDSPLTSNNGRYTDFVGFYRVPRGGLKYVV